jgi:3',5'-cyclic AMP phosphodiesterase CpdA
VATKILHLSDLHLGNDIVLRALRNRRCWWKWAKPEVTAGLKRAIRTLNPDFVIISGDIVNKAKSGTFSTAAKYLQDIFEAAGFDIRERLLIVPGNHDVSFFPKANSDDFRRLRRYRSFLQKLFGETDVEARRQRYIVTDESRQVLFACLDSTLKDLFPVAEGEVGKSQRAWLARKLIKLKAQLGDAYKNYTKVAVVHHHCRPISGMPPSSERCMQMLDAEDAMKVLDEFHFDVVLHGHKHYPHVATHQRSDSSVLLLIGAGTATCPYLEEQATRGNNFNVVTISPEANRVSVQLHKADETGEFVPQGEPKCYPLRPIEPLGYSVRKLSKVVTIKEDGTKEVKIVKAGIHIEVPGKSATRIPLRVSSDTAEGKIVDFEHTPGSEIQFEVKTESFIQGAFVLNKPLIYDGEPVDLWYSYRLENGTAMCRKDLPRLYPEGRDKEGTASIVLNPTQFLYMEVCLPQKFPWQPEVSIEHLGAKVSSCAFKFEQDVVNRWKLEVSDPPLQHVFFILWDLPEAWPAEKAPNRKPLQ